MRKRTNKCNQCGKKRRSFVYLCYDCAGNAWIDLLTEKELDAALIYITQKEIEDASLRI